VEAFKGRLRKGQKVGLNAGGGGDCTKSFDVGKLYLIYDGGHVCSRTRSIGSLDDIEVKLLRTGKLPPVPVGAASSPRLVSGSPPHHGYPASASWHRSAPRATHSEDRDMKLTTGTYAHLVVEDLRAAVESITPTGSHRFRIPPGHTIWCR
jgi:hypothetical protein